MVEIFVSIIFRKLFCDLKGRLGSFDVFLQIYNILIWAGCWSVLSLLVHCMDL